MKVLFAASECAPIAKVGGLGDVIGSLPKALLKLGVDAKIIIPFYEEIDRQKWRPELVLRLDNQTLLYQTKVQRGDCCNDGLEVYLVYNKKYLSRGPIYFGRSAFVESVTEVERFVFFSRAVYLLLRDERFFGAEVVHCNDWHTGFLVSLLKNKPKLVSGVVMPKVIFTIHNLANQGITNKGINLMAEGIKYADIVTTVSPTYAKEILTKKYGAGLEKLLQRRNQEKKLVGILNGIDYDFWPKAPHHHNHKKAVPRFGFVARLTSQKGLSLLLPLVPKFVKQYGIEFYFLGQGDEKYEKELQLLAKRFSSKVFVTIGFDEERARWIYSNTDFFLMPSLFEPSGLGQMIAMRYGTIPIVRATGGLRDSVQHLKTGLVFTTASSRALAAVIIKAIKIFENPILYQKLRRNCLAQNFDWTKSAKAYLNLYKS